MHRHAEQHPEDEVLERDPPAGEDEPEHVAEGAHCLVPVEPLHQRPAERPEGVAGELERLESERNPDHRHEHEHAGEHVAGIASQSRANTNQTMFIGVFTGRNVTQAAQRVNRWPAAAARTRRSSHESRTGCGDSSDKGAYSSPRPWPPLTPRARRKDRQRVERRMLRYRPVHESRRTASSSLDTCELTSGRIDDLRRPTAARSSQPATLGSEELPGYGLRQRDSPSPRRRCQPRGACTIDRPSRPRQCSSGELVHGSREGGRRGGLAPFAVMVM